MNSNRPIAIAMLLAMELSSGVVATAQEKDLRLQLAANPPMETVWAKPPDPVIPDELDLRPGFTLITSLDDFRAVIKADGQKIRLKPGIYRADKLDPPLTMKRRHVLEGQQEDDDQQHIFAINGSNNHFDLRGVVIETPVSLQGTMSSKVHVADCWDVNGANNVIEGGYFRNVVDRDYPDYRVAENDKVVMKNCKADLAYNPIFNLTRGDIPKGGFYEVTILNPAEGVQPTLRTSLGRICGDNCTFILRDGTARPLPEECNVLQLGGSKPLVNSRVVNHTAAKLIIGKNVRGCTIDSVGPVENGSGANSIKRIEPG